MRLMAFRWQPSSWAGLAPNGFGQVKPHHYLEIVKTVWHNRRQLPFAWRILRDGVCDGCALGTIGMRDFTMSGVHLCTLRLNLLQLNTMPALDIRRLEDVTALRTRSSAALRRLGRIPYPMMRRRGDPGFQRISWDRALNLAAARIRSTDPQRLAFYLTSRGITNETYYVAQKAARLLGTNNVDNSSRLCHAPSTVALKQTLGVAASTCSYRDWIGTDWLVFIGSDVPNNQPVTTKYMFYAKQQGTKIAVLNPLREPGLERYWVPSVFESALFGTRLADDFFTIHTGGDIAFLNGVVKSLLEIGAVDQEFIDRHTTGFADLCRELDEQSWEMLEKRAGSSRDEMERFARLYAQAKSAVFVWSMGVTQHAFGTENVKAIVNLALARGMIGRPKCGVMPIRGHSGVQGGAEMGCVPWSLPGGDPINSETTAKFARLWGFEVPAAPGLSAVGMIEAAHERKIDILYAAGGNFLETLPEPEFIHDAFAQIPLRIHQDIVITSQMLIDPADTVLVLPAQTRYEQPGGATETSTERYILFSPEIPGRRIGEARPEWQIFMDLTERVYPERRDLIHFDGAAQVRGEIARVVPFYDGIQNLGVKGEAIQWGGPLLCTGGEFPTQTGKANFSALEPPDTQLPPGHFFLSTRRGKQFNSMVHSNYDPLTGSNRDAVFMNAEDAERAGLSEGGAVLVRSSVGELKGRVKFMAIRPGNLQVHWPEGNCLVRRRRLDPACEIPDYNTTVEVIALSDGARKS